MIKFTNLAYPVIDCQSCYCETVLGTCECGVSVNRKNPNTECYASVNFININLTGLPGPKLVEENKKKCVKSGFLAMC